LPGYGFSAKPAQEGWGTDRIARAWGELMSRLGYRRWLAQGGDWGAAVTFVIGEQAPPGCLGIHLNMPIGTPTKQARENPDATDIVALERLGVFRDKGSGYSKQQGTRPQTLGYGLTDSPVGQAAWIFEKLQDWSDNPGSIVDVLGYDAVLDNIMIYWLTATATSSARLYWESFSRFGRSSNEVTLPSGFSTFPKEMSPAPRSWVEQRARNIVYWNELDRGGHFAAWEQPELFTSELRAAFKSLR
jgi:pimeloyl-ACP methyl ester carboxylesterase